MTAETDSLPQRVKSFYERISREGKPAIDELPKLYSADVHFINPVVDERGLDLFTRQWVKALAEYKTFQFENVEVVGDDRMFTLTYTMSLKFAIGPVFHTAMMTDCHAKDGKVVFCRDYFDVVGSLVEPFPIISWIYKKVFGLVVA